jgi:hypothetical protein
MTITRRDAMTGFILATGLTFALGAPASAASASKLICSSDAALETLYSNHGLNGICDKIKSVVGPWGTINGLVTF